MKKRLMALLALILITLLLEKCSGSKIETIIQVSEPKVVKIGIVTDHGQGVCSGSFVSKEGIVLTCAHCFNHEGIKKVFIKTSKGTVYPAEPLFIDFDKDVAMIAPRTEGLFPYFQFGEAPRVGQQVISMGSPLGIQGVAGVGYIEKVSKAKMLHSAPISPGNSGGPLIDLKGYIIGINEGIFTEGNSLFIAINAFKRKDN